MTKEMYKLVVHDFIEFNEEEPSRHLDLFYIIQDKRRGDWFESLGHIKITKEIKQWLKDVAKDKEVKNLTFKR